MAYETRRKTLTGRPEGATALVVNSAPKLTAPSYINSAMARKLRLQLESAMYHVVNHGNYRAVHVTRGC